MDKFSNFNPYLNLIMKPPRYYDQAGKFVNLAC